MSDQPASLAAALVQLQERLPRIPSADLLELYRAIGAELSRRDREAIASEQDSTAEAGDPDA